MKSFWNGISPIWTTRKITPFFRLSYKKTNRILRLIFADGWYNLNKWTTLFLEWNKSGYRKKASQFKLSIRVETNRKKQHRSNHNTQIICEVSKGNISTTPNDSFCTVKMPNFNSTVSPLLDEVSLGLGLGPQNGSTVFLSNCGITKGASVTRLRTDNAVRISHWIPREKKMLNLEESMETAAKRPITAELTNKRTNILIDYQSRNKDLSMHHIWSVRHILQIFRFLSFHVRSLWKNLNNQHRDGSSFFPPTPWTDITNTHLPMLTNMRLSHTHTKRRFVSLWLILLYRFTYVITPTAHGTHMIVEG